MQEIIPAFPRRSQLQPVEPSLAPRIHRRAQSFRNLTRQALSEGGGKEEGRALRGK
jgi:hypothetical protein